MASGYKLVFCTVKYWRDLGYRVYSGHSFWVGFFDIFITKWQMTGH